MGDGITDKLGAPVSLPSGEHGQRPTAIRALLRVHQERDGKLGHFVEAVTLQLNPNLAKGQERMVQKEKKLIRVKAVKVTVF